LQIPFGKDCLEGIGNPLLAESDLGRMQAKSPVEMWKYAFNRFFPDSGAASEDVMTIPPDPTLADPFFMEKLIDEQRKEKQGQVDKSRKNAERQTGTKAR